MKEAMFYKTKPDAAVQCVLCPRHCFIKEGMSGFCRARKNVGGKLYAMTYGRPVSPSIDPIEKKPFFHFYPGLKTYSFCTLGCNFNCLFCQNWQISQASPEDMSVPYVSPERIVSQCELNGLKCISYTYTEPTVFFEYAYDTAVIAKRAGLLNAFVSNGYIEEAPLRKIAPYLDAMNMDFKANQEQYKKYCGADAYEAVKRTARLCMELNIHLEITTLIVPGMNDDPDTVRDIAIFIRDELGKKVPLHLSRFHPHYKMLEAKPTPIETLVQAKKVAEDVGLHYVYMGNVPGEGEDTKCPNCKAIIIKRSGFTVLEYRLLDEHRCPECGKKVYLRGEYQDV